MDIKARSVSVGAPRFAEIATNTDRSSNSFRIRSVMVLAFTLSMYRDIAGHEELTGKIIECGIRVHEIFGPGLLESVYRPCLTLGTS